jgi:hypothetical protein
MGIEPVSDRGSRIKLSVADLIFRIIYRPGNTVAIYRLLQKFLLGPEEIAALTGAYARALVLVDRNDPITELVAKKIIELGQRGVRDAKQLSDLAMNEVGERGCQGAINEACLYCSPG